MGMSGEGEGRHSPAYSPLLVFWADIIHTLLLHREEFREVDVSGVSGECFLW